MSGPGASAPTTGSSSVGRASGFNDNMIQLGFETSPAKPSAPEAGGGSSKERDEALPIYLDLDDLTASLGKDFVIEYKYFVKN